MTTTEKGAVDSASVLEETTLADRLAALSRHAPAELVQSVVAEIEQLVRSHVAAGAPQAGEMVPSFTLREGRGRLVSLADQLARGPVVIVFYRGGWCPYCDLQLRAYQKILPRITELGGTLIAISPQTPSATLSTAENKHLKFAVLSDPSNRVARAFGLVFKVPPRLDEIQRAFGVDVPGANGDDSNELPVTATFVVEPNGRVAFRHLDVDWRNRLEPAQLLLWLEQVRSRRES